MLRNVMGVRDVRSTVTKVYVSNAVIVMGMWGGVNFLDKKYFVTLA